MTFRDRADAGQQLAARLADTLGAGGPQATASLLVLGIPRGGVIVAAQIAQSLGAPLDVFITHKLGAPHRPELAIGAVASDGTLYVNPLIVETYRIPQHFVERERDAQLREIRRREALYRQGRPPLTLAGRTAIIVDDGVATGATTLAALRGVRSQRPARLVLAVPVAPLEIARALADECDVAVILLTPQDFQSVGSFYESFEQTTDEQVIAALASAAGGPTLGEGA